jgi:N-methylhydantoinase A/oxoprolinase/acetone carboxylase beta subunit
MGFTVDIDTGGTFTDGLFTSGEEIKRVKVDTTPHDITVSWLNALEEGGRQFGFSTLTEFLEQVDIVRWSNTTATNIIAERKGPKLGLFVTEGNQKTLYASGPKSPAFGQLIDEAHVESVKFPLDANTLVIQLKRILEKGVRRICISLKDGLKNLHEEIEVKKIFEEQYPDHYLGNVPFLLAGDICKHPDDMTRTHVALLNSYVHGPMARAMFKAEDDLRERGYNKPLLLGHTDGGVARVSKTRPVDTIESGPIFGIYAGAFWADLYQLPNVITLDVGGTTSKIGLVDGFRPAITKVAEVFGVPLRQNMLDLRSIALGGGTVARVVDGKLELGPKSMGAYPGPACYDLGGTEATLTDAYLAKGFLDPNYFAGGTKKINPERAKKILHEKVAGPLGVDTQTAAYEISQRATQMIAEEIVDLIRKTGKPPGEFVLFAFGGNGGIVGCEVAKKTETKAVHVFSLGAVLSAFGSSVADVSHTYEYSPFVPASEPKALLGIIDRMVEDARRDMEGEGFDLDKVETELEFALYDNENPQTLTHAKCPWSIKALGEETMLNMIHEGFKQFELGPRADALTVEVLRLRAKAPVSKMRPAEAPSGNVDAAAACKGDRDVWPGNERVPCQLYAWDKLQPGNVIAGPALIEGIDATYITPRGWKLTVDSFNNGILSRG